MIKVKLERIYKFNLGNKTKMEEYIYLSSYISKF